jgi:hypothetical protein
MQDFIEIDAEPAEVEPSTVFQAREDDITTENAIPPDAMEVGIYLTLQALEAELCERLFREPAVQAIIDGVRKRVSVA